DVNIHLVGEAQEVERADGLVEQQLFTLTVHAKPVDLPNAIDVDVSSLSIGDAIRVGDLTLPAGVTTEVDPEEAVVVAQASSMAAEVEEDEAAAQAVATGEQPGTPAEESGGSGGGSAAQEG
ncbi:MAG: 50S ribosomal protein L25, partial [Actinomycetota bacterium]|nr:50S ribosomal protein L25 [Actinomycetota bacterium]